VLEDAIQELHFHYTSTRKRLCCLGGRFLLLLQI
jgi:hypothetical protein